ncbi:hypothetical protein HRJ34_21115 [Rhizorhabdus wittichii]|uniref:Uncharacterized protein n=1 Tax=Rhizorhabdus wittichii TaxID=160791 RepID=A0A975D181_9SPHN|nr:hypothetical protein [Rhizorhabdus wittichii]QTH20798.1 hypothetical protein HRJ34_21115 [Rhizorhabdus wittichii]
MGTAIPTRRAALGTLIAAPFVIGAPVAALPSPAAGAFEQALATLERAKAAHYAAIETMDAAEAAFYAACQPRQPMAELADSERAARKQADVEARQRFGVDEALEMEGLAGSAACDALAAVLATPAPDIAAVVLKIELARDGSLGIDDLAPVLADLRRLGAPLASVGAGRS